MSCGRFKMDICRTTVEPADDVDADDAILGTKKLSKDNSNEEVDDDKKKCVLDAMFPVLRWMQLLGIIPSPLNMYKEEVSTSRFIFWKAYTIIPAICVVYTVLCEYDPGVTELVSTNTLTKVALFVLIAILGLWYMVLWLIAALKHRSFLRFLSSFEEVGGICDKNDKNEIFIFTRRISRIAAVACGVMLLASFAFQASQKIDVPGREIKFVPFQQMNATLPRPVQIVAGVVFSILSGIAGVNQFIIISFYIACCCVIVKRFQQISKHHSELKELNAAGLERVRLAHHGACCLVSQLDDSFYILNGVWSVADIVILVCVAYLMIFLKNGVGYSGAEIKTFLFSGFSVFGVLMLLRSWAGVRLHEAAHSLVNWLHGLSYKYLDAADRVQVSNLLIKLVGPPIGVTVFNFFVITRSFLLTLFGIFATYVILLVQFETAADCNCSSSADNRTTLA